MNKVGILLIDTSGYKQTAIFIDTQGDEWLEHHRTDELKTEIKLSSGRDYKKMPGIRHCRTVGFHVPFACQTYGSGREEM